jgi:dipeptidyl aminopeptidase/acylaminoacyl peptidase
MRSLLASLCVLVSFASLAQEAVPSSLETENIPAIPAELVESVRPYLENRQATFLGWSAGNTPRALISTRFSATNQLHLLAMPGGDRKQLTFFSDGINEALFQPREPNVVIFSKDVGGDENYQIYRYDLATGAITLLTDGKSRNLSLLFSRDGRLLVYASTRRNGKDTDIWIDDLTDAAGPRLAVQLEGGGWEATDVSHDGKTLALLNEISANETEVYLADVAAGTKRLVTPPKSKVAYASPHFSATGQELYFTSDEGSEFQQLVRMRLPDGRTEVISKEPWDVESFAVSDDGSRIAYLTNENGISVLHLIDVKGRSLPLPKIPQGLIGDLRWHSNNRLLGFDVEGARAPQDVYSVDVETGSLQRWTESETGGLNPSRNPEAELVTLASFDGTRISAFVYRPDAKRHPGRRPSLMIIHGGPEDQTRPWFQGRLNYWVNELGIALVFPNVRGSTGYGKTYLAMDNGLKREDSVKDIGAVLDWIAGDSLLDGKRVGVYGGSYGGYMTLATMIHYADRIRCGIDYVGISSYVTFLENTSEYRRDLRRVEYGDERVPEMRQFLSRISPLTNASKITKPLFVVAGFNDPRVPWTEGQQIVKTVRGSGAPVWWLMARDEGHGFAKKPNRDYHFYAMTLFLRTYLQGN